PHHFPRTRAFRKTHRARRHRKGLSSPSFLPLPMNRRFALRFVFAALVLGPIARPALAANNNSSAQPRVFVLTDIENEPDDAMSLVRFLVYANHFSIEGLVATTSEHQRARVAPQRIRRIVEAYGKVRDNLELHEPGFP